MKKILALILCLVMAFSVFPVALAAEKENEMLTKYPVIMIPGYTSSAFYKIDEETGEKVMVWGDAVGQVSSGAGEGSLEAILPEVGKFVATGDAKGLATVLGDGFNRIFADLKCNDDGTPSVPVYNYVHTAEETNYANLAEKYPDGDYQAEKEIMGDICAKIGKENAYVFTCDFRMGAVEIATSLRTYIDDVIAYHNRNKAEKDKIDKVNIYSLSHGGQVAGTYLTLYGYEGKVNNALLTVPALGGAGIAYDAFNGDVNFNDPQLIQFVQHGFLVEEDFDLLFRGNPLDFIDELVEELLPVCMKTLGCWGSLWDFVPLEQYEEMKAKNLDPVKNAGLIAQSDFVHYQIMSPDGEYYYAKGFEKAQNSGVNIYIIAGYDVQVVTGMNVSSDSLIPIEGATGAVAAPYGQRFSDGYKQKVDTGIYQVSPSMTVDASTGYLPYQTWYVENFHHGMTYKDDFTFSLACKLLLTDGVRYTVQSLPEYPQFHATTNPAHVVFAEFDNSNEGYISSQDKELIITNISYDSVITVSSVSVYGADFGFFFLPFVLKPGESKSIKVRGDIPKVSLKNVELSVAYLNNKVTPVCERTFDFTIMNGDEFAYNEKEPLTNADYPRNIDNVLPSQINGVLEKLGVKDIASNFLNMFAQLLNILTKVFYR